MRKKVFGRHLSRGSGARKALFRSQVRSLVFGGGIKTTIAKAKSVQVEIDHLMKLVRINSLASKRRAAEIIGNDRQTLEDLWVKYSVAANQRNSGFTRIINFGPRKGDRAEIVRLELVDKASEVKKETKTKKTKPVNKVAVKPAIKTIKKAAPAKKTVAKKAASAKKGKK